MYVLNHGNHSPQHHAVLHTAVWLTTESLWDGTEVTEATPCNGLHLFTYSHGRKGLVIQDTRICNILSSLAVFSAVIHSKWLSVSQNFWMIHFNNLLLHFLIGKQSRALSGPIV